VTRDGGDDDDDDDDEIVLCYYHHSHQAMTTVRRHTTRYQLLDRCYVGTYLTLTFSAPSCFLAGAVLEENIFWRAGARQKVDDLF